METSPNYYLKENELIPLHEFDEKALLRSGLNVYEVMRVIRGIPLFIEDHYQRFSESTQARNIETGTDREEFVRRTLKLIRMNGMHEGNIKTVYHRNEEESFLLIYPIPHFYPGQEMYTFGTETCIVDLTRPDPNYKNWRPGFKEKVASIKKESGFYEILLANEQGFITEGSQSNFFLIRGGSVYTPHSDQILPGITRQKVLQLLSAKNIRLVEADIDYEFLTESDSAFITGTSPKILPLSKINNITFDVNNTILRQVMKDYDDLLRDYVSGFHD
jgi:branched-chain amino acid aminotransferase